MVEAKDIATFIIEPTGADIYAPTGFLVRKRFHDIETTTTYTSSQGQTLFQAISDSGFCTGASAQGCRIYLKNGLYSIGNELAKGSGTGNLIELSTTTDGSHVNVYLEGETRDGVIIRNTNTTMESTRIFLVRCNFDVRNLTMDGANSRVNSTFTSLIDHFGQSSGTPTLSVRDCRLMRANGSSVRTAGPWYAMIVENCIVEKPCEFHDQIDIGCSGYTQIRNNFCDRTNGTYTGSASTITAGGGGRIIVDGNIIKRNVGQTVFAISLEGSFGSFDFCTISNNMIENGRIWIGDIGSWSNTIKNVSVTGNKLYQGSIYVQGPTSGTYTDIVKGVMDENNQLFDSWEAGIHCDHVGGFCSIRNNTIKGSNKLGVTYSGQEPLIFLESSIDIVCEHNILYMGEVSPPDANFSPEGIRFNSLVNPYIRNNRIINRSGHPSYVNNGSNSGT
jgi:hypothetical protein